MRHGVVPRSPSDRSYPNRPHPDPPPEIPGEGVRAHPHEVSRTPQGVRAQPHQVSRTPQGVGAQPHEVSRTQQGVRAHPHEVSRTPQGVRAQPHEVSRTPRGQGNRMCCRIASPSPGIPGEGRGGGRQHGGFRRTKTPSHPPPEIPGEVKEGPHSTCDRPAPGVKRGLRFLDEFRR
jgi:hypothetical protein